MNEDGRPERQKNRGWNALSRSAIHPRLTGSSQRYNTLDFPRESRVPKGKESPLETSTLYFQLSIGGANQYYIYFEIDTRL